MTIKELFKSNIPRSILIIVLYVLYAFSGSFSQYFLKYALNGITAGKLNTFIYWQVIQAVLEIITACFCQLQPQFLPDKRKIICI